MSETRVYLAEGAPLRRQNSAVERRKEMNSIRIMSKKDREEKTSQGFDSGNKRKGDGGDAVVKAVKKSVTENRERRGKEEDRGKQ